MAEFPSLHFLGHSTVLIELDGVRVLTDPVLLPRVANVLRRTAAPLDPALHANVDAVCISHLHADHLDLASLRRLGRSTLLVVPEGAGEFLYRKGFREVVELAPGKFHDVGRVRITATPAVHDGHRPPFGPRALAVGYVVEGATSRVYFAGDTDEFDEMDDLGALGLDVALIPVWGWGPNLGPGHLDPSGAAHATGRLKPTYAVPIHWGTLHPFGIGRWMRAHLVDPPRRYAQAVTELGLSTRVLHTEPGCRVEVA
ncbi:MBL fold metallo-hydrolase [Cryptosporangium phraense]|uniref:MBL fold metallo-hydrolase n=1 Tax=Cryptosporangium phraense TaxID=2593070 RepID=A0A545AWQ8_9ACTN|nr:MBL fold metallo-hydrolase [Cryptosporangium phraense]TQS45767.1 MBL fold metallo-hydrolase [Cryptosporangium phraense]